MSSEEKNEEVQPEEAVEAAAEAATEADAPGSAGDAPGHEEALGLLEDARNKADEHWNQCLLLQADLENLRKRSAKDVENAHKFALEKFMSELLPIRDSMEMGLNAAQDDGVDINSLREGMDLTLKMMVSAMDKFNITVVDPEGEPFNPDLHQAMSMVPNPDLPANTVMNVVQKGYQLNERLIRPAMVIVSKAAE